MSEVLVSIQRKNQLDWLRQLVDISSQLLLGNCLKVTIDEYVQIILKFLILTVNLADQYSLFWRLTQMETLSLCPPLTSLLPFSPRLICFFHHAPFLIKPCLSGASSYFYLFLNKSSTSTSFTRGNKNGICLIFLQPMN